MNPKPFFDALYWDSQGLVEMRALGDGKPWREFCEWNEYHKITQFACRAMAQNRNVYFGVSTRDGNGGKKENLMSIPAVWCDIDFKETPKEEALKILRDFPFKASMIVSTGAGVHCYWILKEPLLPMDDDTAIAQVEDVNKRIAAYIPADLNACDVTRILRIPETANFKYDPCRMVKITYMEKWKYDLDAFQEFLPEAPSPLVATNGQDKTIFVEDNMTAIMKCDFIRWCSYYPAKVSEPLWYAMISNLASVRPGGVSMIHEFSKNHPGYTPEETNRKILHALEESRPISCAKIRERGFKCKKKCSVTSPAALVFEVEVDEGVQEDVKFAQISFINSEGNNNKVADPRR
jgi:hypothetical protein